MAERKRMFSDAWHRVANKHAALRPGVEVLRQHYRGRRWYVLKDPFKNSFFRVTDAAYGFISRLRANRTIDEAWQESLEIDPEEAPGQEEVIELLGHLNNASLIQSDMPSDTRQLFDKYSKAHNKELRQKWLNFLFLKINLFNPDAFLRACLPAARLVLNKFGIALWILLLIVGLKVVLENAPVLMDKANGVLRPDNLFLLLVATIFLKAVHEFGHGIVCRLLGGAVPTVGMMLVALMPLPYVDATSSWSFKSKWKRIAVSGAGMFFELGIAAIAAIIWASTDRGTIHALAYNVMFSASVTTLLFNLNPLLKFDGYYIFSDLLELPNLQQRSTNQLRFLLEHYAFGSRYAVNPSRTLSEGILLGLYGISAGIYRVFLMLSISLFVAEQYFEIGILLAISCVIIYVLLPIGKFLKYLTTDKGLQRVRTRALATVSATVLLLAAALLAIPAPRAFSEPGVLWPAERRWVHPETDGFLHEVLTPPGQWVTPGTPLLRLTNRELDLQIASLQSGLRQVEARIESAGRSDSAALPALRAQLEHERQRLALFAAEREALTVLSPSEGYWAAPELEESLGTWVTKGSAIGRIVRPSPPVFLAIVSQREAFGIFAHGSEDAEIRLNGRAGTVLSARIERIVPAGQSKLPTPSLCWAGGGEVEVLHDDHEGLAVVDSYFILEAALSSDPGPFFDEHRGKIRFPVPPAPLAIQVFDEARKLVQKRLRL